MSQLNIKDLYTTMNEKTLKRMEIYDTVLQKCHKRIKYHSTLQRTYCFFQIPEFIIGVQLFDPQELKTYIMNSLKTNGFQFLYIEPNWLFVNWDLKGAKRLIHNGSKDTPTKPTQPTDTRDYRKIDSYKPSGFLGSVYDPAQLMTFSDTFK
jgi:hypothetical protein